MTNDKITPKRKPASLLVKLTTGFITLNGFRLTGFCLILIGIATALDQNSRIPNWIYERVPLLSQSVMAWVMTLCGGILIARDYRVGSKVSPLIFTAPLYALFTFMLIYVQQGVAAPPSYFSYALIFTGAIHVVFVGFHSTIITEYQQEIRNLLIQLEFKRLQEADNATQPIP